MNDNWRFSKLGYLGSHAAHPLRKHESPLPDGSICIFQSLHGCTRPKWALLKGNRQKMLMSCSWLITNLVYWKLEKNISLANPPLKTEQGLWQNSRVNLREVDEAMASDTSGNLHPKTVLIWVLTGTIHSLPAGTTFESLTWKILFSIELSLIPRSHHPLAVSILICYDFNSLNTDLFPYKYCTFKKSQTLYLLSK